MELNVSMQIILAVKYECYFKQYSESHGVENSPASQLEVRVQSHPGLNFLDLSVTAHKVVLVTVRII